MEIQQFDSDSDSNSILNQIQNGEIKHVFMTPETLMTKKAEKFMKLWENQKNLGGVVIDECHNMITSFDCQFRDESYPNILIPFGNRLKILVLSGTIILHVELSLSKFCLECGRSIDSTKYHTVYGQVNRSNIFLMSYQVSNNKFFKALKPLLESMEYHIDPSTFPHTIIYTQSVNDTTELTQFLWKLFPHYQKYIFKYFS